MNDQQGLSPSLRQGIDALRNVSIPADSMERALERARQIALQASVRPQRSGQRRRLIDVLAASVILIIASLLPMLARSDTTVQLAGVPAVRVSVFEIAIVGFTAAIGVLLSNRWTARSESRSNEVGWRGFLSKKALLAILLMVSAIAACYAIPVYFQFRKHGQQRSVAETIRQSGWTVVEQDRLTWQIQADGRAVTDDDLAALAVRLPALSRVSLDLGHSRATDAGLEHLRGRVNPIFLGLSHTAVTDKGVDCLTEMDNLRNIDLTGTRITDASLGSLAGLRLDFLNLSQTAITDRGLATLPPTFPVFRINLSETNVSDVGLKHLAAWSSLKWLDLSKTKVTGEAFREFQNSPIEVLELGGAPITDAALLNIATLRKLIEVHLKGTRVTPDGVDRLRTKAPAIGIFR